jgi:cyclopropane fatty-acyl-phospholipid synthase-like methyltransferase
MSKLTVGSSRRLLDVGCGMGGFLIVTRELGFEVNGLVLPIKKYTCI